MTHLVAIIEVVVEISDELVQSWRVNAYKKVVFVISMAAEKVIIDIEVEFKLRAEQEIACDSPVGKLSGGSLGTRDLKLRGAARHEHDNANDEKEASRSWSRAVEFFLSWKTSCCLSIIFYLF